MKRAHLGLLTAVLLLGGCVDRAVQNLRHASRIQLGLVNATHDEAFAPDADPLQHTSIFGRSILLDARRADPAIDAFVDQQGRPDGIAVGKEGARVTLYYLKTSTVYVFEPTAAVAEETPQRTLIETRPMLEAERLAIRKPDLGRTLHEILDERTAAQERLWRLATPLLAQVEGEHEPGYRYGFDVIAVDHWNPALKHLMMAMGQPVNVEGVVVAVVEAGTPAAGVLQRGDLIVELDGKRILSPRDWEVTPKAKEMRLRIVRGEVESQVTLQPQVVRLPVRFVAVRAETLNAFSGEDTVIVTTALLREANDDVIAFALGHEIGHILERHSVSSPAELAGKALVAAPLAPLLLVPVVGQVTSNALTGIEDRNKREQEIRADEYGVRLAARAGFRPDAGLEFLELTRRYSSIPALREYFDIHPPYQERSATLRATIEAVKAAPH